MVDNQHKQISGYRDLTPADIDLMNEVKALGAKVGEITARIKELPETDQRWLATGVTDLQKGFMSVIRAITKPTTFA